MFMTGPQNLIMGFHLNPRARACAGARGQRPEPGRTVVLSACRPQRPTYAAALMAGPNVVTLRADLREPEQVLGNTQVRDLFDFGQPVGIMLMCVLHCLWDKEDPWGVVGQFRDVVAPGSYLALSHMTSEAHPEAAEGLFRMTQDLHWNTPLISRDRADIARFFDGFTLVEPGLVAPAQWRPDLDDPLRDRQDPDDGGEPVLKLVSPEPPTDDRGVGWHLCGVGIKDQA